MRPADERSGFHKRILRVCLLERGARLLDLLFARAFPNQLELLFSRPQLLPSHLVAGPNRVELLRWDDALLMQLPDALEVALPAVGISPRALGRR